MASLTRDPPETCDKCRKPFGTATPIHVTMREANEPPPYLEYYWCVECANARFMELLTKTDAPEA